MFGFRDRGPVDDLSVYGSKASQLERFKAGHEEVAQALLNAAPEQFEQPPSAKCWADA